MFVEVFVRVYNICHAALRELESKIRDFLDRGAATGTFIEEIRERTACQVLLDY